MGFFSGVGGFLSKGFTLGPMHLTFGDALVGVAGFAGSFIPFPGAGMAVAGLAGGAVEAVEEKGKNQNLNWGRILGAGALGATGDGAGRLAGKGITAVLGKVLGKVLKNGMGDVTKAIVKGGADGLGASAGFSLMSPPQNPLNLPMRAIGESHRQNVRMVAAEGNVGNFGDNDYSKQNYLHEYDKKNSSDSDTPGGSQDDGSTSNPQVTV